MAAPSELGTQCEPRPGRRVRRLANHRSADPLGCRLAEALVEAVELRVAAARTDEELSQAVERFLPPLLLKLASPDAAVRQKVRRTMPRHCVKGN